MKTNLQRDKIVAVANYLLTNYSDQINDHIKIQKILYFLDFDCKNKTGQVLLDEPFETWFYEPVNRQIFATIKENDLIFETDYELNDEDKKFIKKDVKQYLKQDSFDLVTQSQPWIDTREDYSP